MASDLSPLLRRSSYHDVAGVELSVPWAPAIVWIQAVSRDSRTLVVALADDGQEDVAVRLALGEITVRDVERATHQMLEEQTGFRWFVAIRLIHTSAGTDVLGELTLSGVRPDQVSIGQWCAATYRVLTRNADKKQRLKLDFELELPPLGYEDAWDDGNDYAAMVELARKVKEREAGRSG